jgi:RNA polymerase sigma-32 factor
MQNFIIKTWSLVKIGTTQAQRKLFFKLNQAKKKLQNLSTKNPEFAEIAETLNVKEAEIEEMDLRLNNRDLSLDAFIDEDGELSHLDVLAYEGESQEESLIKKQETALVKRNIAGVLAKLSERERYIIRNRIMSETPETLQEIGDRFKITRERARQVEKEALKKMRHAILPWEGDQRAVNA